MASLDLGSLTYSVITANQIRLVDLVNHGRGHDACGSGYFLGVGAAMLACAFAAPSPGLGGYWGNLALAVIAFAISALFARSAKQHPSGGVVAILEAAGLPLEEVTVRVKVTPVNNAGEPVSFPETSMVPQ